jgi:hypothetical protein
MKYTSKAPTTPGWYWLKKPLTTTRVVEVVMIGDRLKVEYPYTIWLDTMNTLGAMWAGPIPEPEIPDRG